MDKGFNASAYQIVQGYRYFRNVPIPSNLPFAIAANGLIGDFGHERVKAVLLAIKSLNDADAQAEARAADLGEVTTG